jgi:hypothetical protein
MAGTFTVQSNPAFLTARTLIYTAWQLRNVFDGDPPAPGVADYESFRVKQRGAGANLSVDVGNTALNTAWVRGTTRDGMGLYRADNIDYTAPTANTFLAQINTGTIFTTGDATNPRIDQVFLRILDQQHDGGGSNLLQIQVVDGTPTGGATLDNRTGVGAVPANSILLADVLQPALSATIVTANIRDRRQFPLLGSIPQTVTAVNGDQVAFIPHPALPVSANVAIASNGQLDLFQSAALMYLPKRIVGATKIRWRYRQGATAAAHNWIIGIYDASGRQVAATAATAFTGGANVDIAATTNLVSTTTFEAGWYYVLYGNATAGAGATVNGFCAVPTNAVGTPSTANVGLTIGSGSTTLPTTILGLADMYAVASAVRPGVPVITLGVA